MARRKTNTATTLDGTRFLTDLEQQPGLAVDERFAYHMGVTAECPVNQIDCAGFNFPKTQEIVRPNADIPGETERVKVVGGICDHITYRDLQTLEQLLPRLVVRFFEAIDPENPGRPRKGRVVKIPSDDEIREKMKRNLPVHRYPREPHDEPAAKFMYMRLCADQKRPKRTTNMDTGEIEAPPTIAAEGITWPGITPDEPAPAETVATQQEQPAEK